MEKIRRRFDASFKARVALEAIRGERTITELAAVYGVHLTVLIAVDPRYFRPTEVYELLGDASKAQQMLGWKSKIGFEELVRRVVVADLRDADKDLLCRSAGFM